MDGTGTNGILDSDVVRSVKEFSTVELVRLLFPGHAVRSRGVMCSPFRNDRNPSFSCFRGRDGISMWKDHATDESGDNITLYRKVYPSLDYCEAVDRLAMLVVGRTAYAAGRAQGRSVGRSFDGGASVARSSSVRKSAVESAGALRIVRRFAIGEQGYPREMESYWRNRAISDIVMRDMGAVVIEYENVNRKGGVMTDSVSGLPILGDDGVPLKESGIHYAVGHVNDVGGVVVREPDTEARRGFKGNIGNQWVTTILAGGSRPARTVSFIGGGDNAVTGLSYDSGALFLRIGDGQGFGGVSPDAGPLALEVLRPYAGRNLDSLDIKRLTACLDALNAPVAHDVVVMEGVFDALSYCEMNCSRGNLTGGSDIVVLNSVSNIHAAVPFICRHAAVSLMMDNDLRSGAGQNACRRLCGELASFGSAVGRAVAVRDSSGLYAGYKDLNEALMARKGFPADYRPVVRNARRDVKKKRNSVNHKI